MKTNLSIVGIGASAGGLEAINELFENLPDNTGLSFVLIQHLSPNFKSLMNSLLGRFTRMPIRVVNRDTLIEPNKIYLIDSASNVIIEDMLLKPVKRTEPPFPNLPIDQFLHSLSKQSVSLAVGVILSGTGTDGSRGIRSLKSSNGMVLVQTPSSSQFDGMPRAAIATGLADRVLSPKEIAAALVQLARRYATVMDKKVEQHDLIPEEPLTLILDRILQVTGYDFHDYRMTTIMRRIQKRQLLTHYRKLETYLEHVLNDEEEAHILRKEFLIGVTAFFRDEKAFEFLQNEILPALFEHKKDETIRVWLPGCSTGEEAYTMAILFEEYMRRHQLDASYKIFATDVNQESIKAAKNGVYTLKSNSMLTNQLIEWYFRRISEEEFKVDSRIRDNIVFAIHNAIVDPPFIQMDLISCRNFLIYLNQETQNRLLSNFHFGLNHLGYLFLGMSETPGKLRSSFRTISEKYKVYQVNEPGKAIELHQVEMDNIQQRILSGNIDPIPREEVTSNNMQITTKPKGPMQSKTYYRHLLLTRYAPDCIVVDAEMNLHFINGKLERILRFPSSTDDFTLDEMLDFRNLIIFKNGIRQAQESGRPVRLEGVSFSKDDETLSADLTFESLAPGEEPELYLVEIHLKKADGDKEAESTVYAAGDSLEDQQMKEMEREIKSLQQDKEDLRNELGNVQQELQSSTEELQAANEELQSGNETLQSLNEELYTVNAELQEKVRELVIANSDMDNLLRTTEIATIFIDKELKIRKFTPNLARYFQLLETDIGRRITTFVHNIPGIDFFEEIKSVIESNIRVEREITDLNNKTYLMRIFPYLIKGQVQGAVASFIDVTLLKDTIRQMENMANQFRALFENTNYNITIFSPEGEILDINFLFGDQDKSAVIGTNIFDYDLPEEKLVREKIREVVETKKAAGLQTMVYTATGDEMWLTSNYIPLLEDGEVTKILSINRDETYYKGVEGRLHLNAAIFKTIFQHDQQHVLIMNPEGEILEINYTDAGYTKEDLVGKNFIEITTDEQRAIAQNAYDRIMAGEDHVTYQTRIITDDKIWYYQNQLLPVHLDGKMQAIVMLAREITDKSKIDFSNWEEKPAAS